VPAAVFVPVEVPTGEPVVEPTAPVFPPLTAAPAPTAVLVPVEVPTGVPVVEPTPAVARPLIASPAPVAVLVPVEVPVAVGAPAPVPAAVVPVFVPVLVVPAAAPAGTTTMPGDATPPLPPAGYAPTLTELVPLVLMPPPLAGAAPAPVTLVL
jgi:hypothetical protein